MLRLNSLHMMTIFELIENDGDGLDDIKNYLNSTNDDDDLSLEQLSPSAAPIIRSYLTTVSQSFGVPVDEYFSQINATMVFIAKLSLLMHNDVVFAIVHTSREKHLAKVKSLCKHSNKVFKANIIEARLYLFIKMNAWKDHFSLGSSDDCKYLIKRATWKNLPHLQGSYFKFLLDNHFQLLAAIFNQKLTNDEEKNDFKNTLFSFATFIENKEDYYDRLRWGGHFVVKAKDWYSEIPTYNERNRALKFLYASFEIIKYDLKLDDIDWLIHQSERLRQEYPSVFRRVAGGVISHEAGFRNSLNMALPVYVIFLLSTLLIVENIKTFARDDREAIIADYELLPDFLRAYDLHDDNAFNAYRKAMLNGIMMAMATMLITGCFLVRRYARSAFFSRPEFDIPVALPTWCVKRHDELTHPTPQEVIRTSYSSLMPT